MYAIKDLCCLLLLSFPLLVISADLRRSIQNRKQYTETDPGPFSAEIMFSCGFECTVEKNEEEDTNPLPTQLTAVPSTTLSDKTTHFSTERNIDETTKMYTDTSTQQGTTSAVPITTLIDKTPHYVTERNVDETTKMYTVPSTNQGTTFAVPSTTLIDKTPHYSTEMNKDQTTKMYTISSTNQELPSAVPSTTFIKNTKDSTERNINETTKMYTVPSTNQEPTQNYWSSTLPSITTCPPDSSLFSKHDLKNIFNDVIKHLNIYKSLNESYYTRAVAVRDKHLKNLEIFLEWFKDRPYHLKHILNEVVKIRERLTPLFNKIEKHLKGYLELERVYEENVQKVKIVKETTEKIIQVCKIRNCIPYNSEDIQSRVERRSNSRYCGTKSAIWEKVKNPISDFKNTYASQLTNRVNDDDMNYLKKVETLKNQLKDIALKEFGRTMYDILNLLDEYHHLDELLQTDLKSDVLKIQTNNHNTLAMLIALNASLDDLDKYCTTCTPNYAVHRLALFSISDNSISHEAEKDMVDQLIKEELLQIKDKVEDDYKNVFVQLDRNLNHTISLKENLELLKPIQNEVIKITNAETEVLNKIRRTVPKSSIESVSSLSSKTLMLYQLVQDIRTELKKKYDIQ